MEKVENNIHRYHNELNINTYEEVEPQLQRIVRIIEDIGNYDINDSMVDDMEQGNERGTDNTDVVRHLTVAPTTNNNGTVVHVEGVVEDQVDVNDQDDDEDTIFQVPKLISLLQEEMIRNTNVPASNSPFIFKEGLTTRELNRKLDVVRSDETEDGKWSTNNFVTNRENWKQHRPRVLNNTVTLDVLGPVLLAICIVCNKQRKYFELAYDFEFPDFETDLMEIMKCLNAIKKAKNNSSVIVAQSSKLKDFSSVKYLLDRKLNYNKSTYEGKTLNPVMSTLLKLEAVQKRKDLIEKSMGGIFSIGDCFADSPEDVCTANIASYAVLSTDFICHFTNPGTQHDPHSTTFWVPRQIVFNSVEFGVVKRERMKDMIKQISNSMIVR